MSQQKMPPTPVLQTPRLVLRPLRTKDAPVIQKAALQALAVLVRLAGNPDMPVEQHPEVQQAQVELEQAQLQLKRKIGHQRTRDSGEFAPLGARFRNQIKQLITVVTNATMIDHDEAVAIVLKSRRASISSVQRQLRIGYNRAARLIEEMERAGLVSAMQSNGNREVLAPNTNQD